MGERAGHGKGHADHRPSRDDLGTTGVEKKRPQRGVRARRSSHQLAAHGMIANKISKAA